MGFRDDGRGQAIQIGFILIFGVLVISFASYQAFVVPGQNSEVEFNHNQQVQGQLQELRNAIVSSVGRATTTAVAVDLGTSYPSRLVAANPPPPSGSLRTVGTTDSGVNLSVNNAVAQNPETADYWNGTQKNFSTGLLEYRPNYNEYNNAPRTVYENTLLYNQFRTANRTVTGQSLVDGNELTLVVLNGSLQAARSSSYTVDIRPVSTPDGATVVEPEPGENLTVSAVSRLPAEQWKKILAGERNAGPGDDRYVTDVNPGPARSDGLYNVELTFEQDATYRLRMAKVGVGNGVTEESTTYLTDVDGEGTSVQQGENATITLSTRDQFGNPVTATTVYADSSTGSFADDQKRTDANGRVQFTYDSGGVSPGTQRLNFSLTPIGGGFDQSTAEDVTENVAVTRSGGSGKTAYTVSWQDPTQTGMNCPNGADGTCTFDANQTSSAELTVDTLPTVDGATVEYAVSNRTVGTVSPTTETTASDGSDATTFRPAANGSINIFATSGASGDTLDVEVINLFRDLLGETGVVKHEQVTDGQWRTVSFSRSYTDPVVVARPLSFDDEAPATVRVRNVTASSFEFRIDEPGKTGVNGFDTGDDLHGKEQFAYWVMENGTHELDGGVTVDVGTRASVPAVSGTSGTATVNYNQSFNSQPVVFSQTQSFNDGTPVVTRQHSVGTGSFEVGLQQAEPNKDAHGDEEVGYIAIEQAQGTNGDAPYEADATGNSVEGVETYGSATDPDVGYTISFSQSFESAPVFIAQQQTLDGPNTGWVRYGDLTPSDVGVAIDEDLNDDDERDHTTESVGYFAIESAGTIYANDSSSGGGGGNN